MFLNSIHKPSYSKAPFGCLLSALLLTAAQHSYSLGPSPVGTGVNGATNVPLKQVPCVSWLGVTGKSASSSNKSSLQNLINETSTKCVLIPAGTFYLSGYITVPNNKTIKGADSQSSIIKADTDLWDTNGFDGVFSVITGTSTGYIASTGVRITELTIDGSGIATYAIAPTGMMDHLVMIKGRCSGVGINSYAAVVSDSQINSHAKNTLMLRPPAQNMPATVPSLANCRGEFIRRASPTAACPEATTGTDGFTYCLAKTLSPAREGAAIYVEGSATNRSLAPVIRNNTITNTGGPALDVNGAWGGRFEYNVVSGNAEWAGVSLYGASNWIVTSNQISHPANQLGQQYHPACGRVNQSAAIFLCQDTNSAVSGNTLITENNFVSGNKVSSYFGVLSIGAPNMLPRNNLFTLNDPSGSTVGCYNNTSTGTLASLQNVWINNYCSGGTTSAPPSTF